MRLDKTQIIAFLNDRGEQQRAEQVQQRLPDQVDTEEHGGLLAQHGISVEDLINKFGSGDGLGRLP